LLAPDDARLFAEVISEKCPNPTPQAKNEISRFQQQSIAQVRTSAFQQRLANAREFKNPGFASTSFTMYSSKRPIARTRRTLTRGPAESLPSPAPPKLAAPLKAAAIGAFTPERYTQRD